MTAPDMARDEKASPADVCSSVARRVGRRGLLAVTIGAVPVIGPWMLSSLVVACCGGLGVGAVATAAATSAGAGAAPAIGLGFWWLMVPLLLVVVGVQALRARRRGATPGRIAAGAAVMLLLSSAVYGGSLVAFAHQQRHSAPVTRSPTLP